MVRDPAPNTRCERLRETVIRLDDLETRRRLVSAIHMSELFLLTDKCDEKYEFRLLILEYLYG